MPAGDEEVRRHANVPFHPKPSPANLTPTRGWPRLDPVPSGDQAQPGKLFRLERSRRGNCQLQRTWAELNRDGSTTWFPFPMVFLELAQGNTAGHRLIG